MEVTQVSARSEKVYLTRIALMSLLGVLAVPAHAQYEPSQPISPTSAQECNAFSAAINQFLAAMNSAHEQCLAANNRTNRPVAESNMGACSQPACQRFHDYVFGRGAADEGRKVSACFAEVNQYQARKAAEERARQQREQELAAQRERQRQQEEANRAKYEAEKAKYEAERVAWQAREQKRLQAQRERNQATEERLKAAKDDRAKQEIIQERDNELKRIAQDRAADSAPTTPVFPSVIGTDYVVQPNQVQESPAAPPVAPQPGAELLSIFNKKNPFGESKGGEIKAGSDPDDPSTWPSPFSGHKDDPGKEQAIGVAAKAFETAFSKAGDVLADDIQRAEATLSGSKAAAYIRDTEDVRSAMKGLERIFRYYDDALSLVKIAKAETPDDRSRAAWELGVKLTQDAAKSGAMWVVNMLPKSAANVIGGPVSWAGSIVFSSEKTAVEPSDVLQRPQAFSLEEKKEVLYRQAQSFDKYQNAWSSSQRDQLAQLSMLVQQEMTQH